MVRVAGRVEALDTRSREVFLGRRIGRFKRSGERSVVRQIAVVVDAKMICGCDCEVGLRVRVGRGGEIVGSRGRWHAPFRCSAVRNSST